jgi:hypothetical protein
MFSVIVDEYSPTLDIPIPIELFYANLEIDSIFVEAFYPAIEASCP